MEGRKGQAEARENEKERIECNLIGVIIDKLTTYHNVLTVNTTKAGKRESAEGMQRAGRQRSIYVPDRSGPRSPSCRSSPELIDPPRCRDGSSPTTGSFLDADRGGNRRSESSRLNGALPQRRSDDLLSDDRGVVGVVE
jgi:hypothetical protein